MRPPPSRRTLVLSIVGTVLCLLVVYWAVKAGERSQPKPTPASAPR